MIFIELNKKLDYETYKDFHDFNIAGADFAVLIKNDHPLISPDNSERYIDNFYNENAKVLQQSCDDLIGALRDKQAGFFDALKLLFKTDFSSNLYKGYISIFNCNPRFVEKKEFQVFYKRSIEDKLGVVFHEILHFAFFEYCDKNFTEKVGGLDKNSGKLWELSEIFNVIVLNTPHFKSVVGREEKLFYTQLNEKLDTAKGVWESVGGDVHKFIEVFF